MVDEKKITLAWICHFSNKEIREILNPKRKIRDIAPWIPALTKMFVKEENIELHIISPHEYISKYHYFKIRNIHYHFFNAHIPIWGRHWPSFLKLDYWSGFICTIRKINRIIKLIQPDIIHLHGAENAYYSSSILQFKERYPVLITIQGFISHLTGNYDYQIRRRKKYEFVILKNFKHFGYRTQKMGKDILDINPGAVLHWHHYPLLEMKQYSKDKKYDIVYFARITKEKGIEDLLHAMSYVVNRKPNTNLCVIGGANHEYIDSLKTLSLKLGIEKSITWAGFLPTQYDVHELASTARISVLPTYNELISGTIIESMFLKLPVVAYDVGSIHEVNTHKEIITLVPKGDIVGLADSMLKIIEDEELQQSIAREGYLRALEMFDNSKIISDLKKAYKEVIDDFKK